MFKKKKEYFYLDPMIREKIDKIISDNAVYFGEEISFSSFVRRSISHYIFFLEKRKGGKQTPK